MLGIRRREFVGLIGGAAAWPIAARGQQPMTPVIGFLRSTPASSSGYIVDAFRQGLSDAGLIEGKNVTVDYRWADNQVDRLSVLADDLVRRQVGVIVGAGSPAAQAGKSATATTPIVFVIGADPISIGLVTTLNRPEGNITGVVFTAVPLTAKLLAMLHELVPKASLIAVLRDPNAPDVDTESRGLEEAGRAIGRQILMVNAANDREFHPAFEKMMQANAAGLLIGSGPFFLSQRRQIVMLAGRYALPTMYNQREYPEVGGLISYGPSQTDAYRRAGIYVSRILKGEKPSDLPVELSTKFELVINLATAKALSIDVPPNLLALADEVIE
jgi:putative tryptophan/tyrosine transport system substrate-binding protein